MLKDTIQILVGVLSLIIGWTKNINIAEEIWRLPYHDSPPYSQESRRREIRILAIKQGLWISMMILGIIMLVSGIATLTSR